MFSRYQDGLNRRWGRFSGVNLNNVFHQFNAAGQPRTINNAAATVLPGWTDTVTETISGRFDYVQNHRRRVIRTWNLQAGGKQKFDAADLDYNVSYSHARGTDDRFIPTATISAETPARPISWALCRSPAISGSPTMRRRGAFARR